MYDPPQPNFGLAIYDMYFDKRGVDHARLLRNKLTELEQTNIPVELSQLTKTALFEGINYKFRYKLKNKPELIPTYTDHKVKKINEKKSILVRYRKHEFWIRESNGIRMIDRECDEAIAFRKKQQQRTTFKQKIEYKDYSVESKEDGLSKIKEAQQLLAHLKKVWPREIKRIQGHVNELSAELEDIDKTIQRS